MNKILNKKEILIKVIKENKYIFLLFFIFLIIALINSLHYSYPDEFENILGGFYIDHGRLPYIGFFSQHGPFAYFFASIITIFTGDSFVKFRLSYAIVNVLLLGLFYIYIRTRIGKKDSIIFLNFSGLILLGATYFWGQMLLADSLAGLLLIPSYIFLFSLIFYRIKPKTLDYIIISILLSAGILTSLTYIYAVFILYLVITIYYLKQNYKNLVNKNTARFISIILAPYVFFLIYLIITRSLNQFYYDAVYFNQHYYINLMPNGKPANNPIRLAVVIFHKFFQSFRAILALSKDFNLSYPFADTLAVSDFFIIIYLLVKRRFSLAFMALGVLVFLNGRSDPLTTSETDYQAIPYQYFSMFNGVFLLFVLWEDLKENVLDAKKLIYGSIFIILGLYYISLTLFYFDKAFSKAYLKYMGEQALIYDRPQVATQINQILSPSDYYWIGPFDFEDQLYIKEKLASRYIVTIPAMDHANRIHTKMIHDFEKNQPSLVVFDTEYSIFGEKPGRFILSYIKNNYVTIAQLQGEGYKIKVYRNNFGMYRLNRHFFIKKSDTNKILKRMADLGYIKLN